MSAQQRRRMLRRVLACFGRDARGATAIEYAMVAVGVACAVAATVFGVGSSLNTNFYAKVEDAVKN